ncbi:Putative amidase AmiD [bacterium HR28]|uniref:Amidase n=1 Tax=Thermomicrobium roseum TaxID=500 RepID=A0A7C1XIE3_THERO|nr:Putative amidase AmiD [bacterium HR28]
MTALIQLSVREIPLRIRQRELSATELVQALLEWIDRTDPTLQAWAEIDRDGALREAERLDRLATRGTVLPLHGVPVGLKDVIDVAGLPTRAGFAPLSDRPAQADATIVARLRELGAVVLGKTHTTQLAFADPAPTRNPWNPERTPGGSSSGSGAAVAARQVPLAVGTQTAGSVLRPAAYCGVVGFKPSLGWLPLDGVIPLAWTLDHLGLFVRSVEDAAYVYVALCAHQRLELPLLTEPPRLLLLVDFLELAEPEVAEHLLDVARRFREAGARVEERRLPVDVGLLLAVHHVIMLAEMGALHQQMLERHPDAYGPRLRSAVEVGQLIPSGALLHARRLRRRLGALLDTFLAQADAALLPTASGPAPGRETTGDRRFQAVWTLLGTPAISVPSGLTRDGLPLATQLVARYGHDRHLLHVAAWCERILPGLPPPPLT